MDRPIVEHENAGGIGALGFGPKSRSRTRMCDEVGAALGAKAGDELSRVVER
jgi:hypothetical protein